MNNRIKRVAEDVGIEIKSQDEIEAFGKMIAQECAAIVSLYIRDLEPQDAITKQTLESAYREIRNTFGVNR